MRRSLPSGSSLHSPVEEQSGKESVTAQRAWAGTEAFAQEGHQPSTGETAG